MNFWLIYFICGVICGPLAFVKMRKRFPNEIAFPVFAGVTVFFFPFVIFSV